MLPPKCQRVSDWRSGEDNAWTRLILFFALCASRREHDSTGTLIPPQQHLFNSAAQTRCRDKGQTRSPRSMARSTSRTLLCRQSTILFPGLSLGHRVVALRPLRLLVRGSGPQYTIARTQTRNSSASCTTRICGSSTRLRRLGKSTDPFHLKKTTRSIFSQDRSRGTAAA